MGDLNGGLFKDQIFMSNLNVFSLVEKILEYLEDGNIYNSVVRDFIVLELIPLEENNPGGARTNWEPHN